MICPQYFEYSPTTRILSDREQACSALDLAARVKMRPRISPSIAGTQWKRPHGECAQLVGKVGK